MRLPHKTLHLLGVLTLFIVSGQQAAGAGDRSAELAAIEETLGHYLEGGKTGDIDRLRRAFHFSARLQFVRNDAYEDWSLEEYLGRRTPGKRSDHGTRVLLIDFAGSAATAKLELDHGEFKFIDYMSLLKIDDRWLIVNKVFHRAQAETVTGKTP
jgi:hypothetical protein